MHPGPEESDWALTSTVSPRVEPLVSRRETFAALQKVSQVTGMDRGAAVVRVLIVVVVDIREGCMMGGRGESAEAATDLYTIGSECLPR